MKKRPQWLPDLAPVTGPIEQVLPKLYEIFHRDVARGELVLNNNPVWWDRRPQTVYGITYEMGFWHLISRVRYLWTTAGKKEEREFDSQRAERLPWFAPIIKHADREDVLVWNYMERALKMRTYLWLVEWDYAIVLEPKQLKSGVVYMIITAYHVDGDATRASLRRKYEKRRCPD